MSSFSLSSISVFCMLSKSPKYISEISPKSFVGECTGALAVNKNPFFSMIRKFPNHSYLKVKNVMLLQFMVYFGLSWCFWLGISWLGAPSLYYVYFILGICVLFGAVIRHILHTRIFKMVGEWTIYFFCALRSLYREHIRADEDIC